MIVQKKAAPAMTRPFFGTYIPCADPPNKTVLMLQGW